MAPGKYIAAAVGCLMIVVLSLATLAAIYPHEGLVFIACAFCLGVLLKRLWHKARNQEHL
jgi:hypothetical protein